EDDTTAEDTGPADFEEAKADPDGELVITENNELDFHRLDALARDYVDAYSEGHRPSAAGLDEEGDRKHDAMSNTPSRPPSLQDYLNEQVGFIELSQELADLIEFLISHTDADGFLKLSDAEIATTSPPGASPEVIEEAVDILQHFDPP